MCGTTPEIAVLIIDPPPLHGADVIGTHSTITSVQLKHSAQICGLVVCPPHVVGRGFAARLGDTKEHHRNSTDCLPA